MVSFDNKLALIKHLDHFRLAKTTVGFVPTMGALHQGHLSLIAKSLQDNAITIVSIFVNPTQFNNQNDLQNYPRTLENDLAQIQTLSDQVLVYAPTVTDLYPENAVATTYHFDGLENQMEGKFRPGHFNGVGTIITKLFEIIKPTNAYFGEKDFQQLQIVKKLTAKYNLNTKIVGCEVFREQNGLAMSSRNERLTAQQRAQGSIIYETLLEAKTLFKHTSAKEVAAYVEKKFSSQTEFELEYFEIACENDLVSCKNKSKNKNYRAFIAVFAKNIRLIDTLALY